MEWKTAQLYCEPFLWCMYCMKAWELAYGWGWAALEWWLNMGMWSCLLAFQGTHWRVEGSGMSVDWVFHPLSSPLFPPLLLLLYISHFLLPSLPPSLALSHCGWSGHQRWHHSRTNWDKATRDKVHILLIWTPSGTDKSVLIGFVHARTFVGGKKVSLLERCPHFRGVLIREVSSFRGRKRFLSEYTLNDPHTPRDKWSLWVWMALFVTLTLSAGQRARCWKPLRLKSDLWVGKINHYQAQNWP